MKWVFIVHKSNCHLARTFFIVEGWFSITSSRSNPNGVNTVHIAIGCTGVTIWSAITRGKHKYRSFPISSLHVHSYGDNKAVSQALYSHTYLYSYTHLYRFSVQIQYYTSSVAFSRVFLVHFPRYWTIFPSSFSPQLLL